ncbi:longitudinals lacking protein, isoforms H/M/V-like isoform X3 [Macrobrachium rosenbergii]|uniref:longitudinals lacking protein, isoforms H/M/V-like isoform X3 n=1 Tax=Macrobrachium rosenbergii TaxID=79674 RepID=UPI0034D632D5
MEELLSLKWNNHRSTFLHILGVLRDKQSYTDVTLACDGKFYSVHKLVLSTCSDYFCAMFEKTACKSPVIVLKDIKSNDLEALLDYMYLGEVNVRQSDLASLIKAAENLRIKGLAVPDDEPPSKKGSVGAPSRRDGGSGSPPAKRKRRDESEDGREDVRPSLGELHTPPPPSSRPKSPGIQRLSPSPLRTPQESHASEDRDNRPLSSPAETSSTHSQAQIPHQSSQQSSLQSAQQLGDQISQPMGNQFRGEETPYVKVEMTDDETDGANRDTYSISSENFKEEGDVGGELSNDLPEFLQQAASSALAGTSASYHQSFAGPSGFQPEVSSWHGDGQSLPGNFPGIGFPPTSQENPPGEEAGYGVSSCDVCGKQFHGCNQRFLLRRHLLTHTGERRHSCPYCSYQANQAGNLNRHIRNLHPAQAAVANLALNELSSSSIIGAGSLAAQHNLIRPLPRGSSRPASAILRPSVSSTAGSISPSQQAPPSSRSLSLSMTEHIPRLQLHPQTSASSPGGNSSVNSVPKVNVANGGPN